MYRGTHTHALSCITSADHCSHSRPPTQDVVAAFASGLPDAIALLGGLLPLEQQPGIVHQWGMMHNDSV